LAASCSGWSYIAAAFREIEGLFVLPSLAVYTTAMVFRVWCWRTLLLEIGAVQVSGVAETLLVGYAARNAFSASRTSGQGSLLPGASRSPTFVLNRCTLFLDGLQLRLFAFLGAGGNLGPVTQHAARISRLEYSPP
jgi:hypothetical protein